MQHNAVPDDDNDNNNDDDRHNNNNNDDRHNDTGDHRDVNSNDGGSQHDFCGREHDRGVKFDGGDFADVDERAWQLNDAGDGCVDRDTGNNDGHGFNSSSDDNSNLDNNICCDDEHPGRDYDERNCRRDVERSV